MATKTIYSCDWCKKDSDEVPSIFGSEKVRPVDWATHDSELLCPSCSKARNEAIATIKTACGG